MSMCILLYKAGDGALQHGCTRWEEGAGNDTKSCVSRCRTTTALAAWRHLPYLLAGLPPFSFSCFQTYSVMATISFSCLTESGAWRSRRGYIIDRYLRSTYLSCHQRMGSARLTFLVLLREKAFFGFLSSSSCMDLGLNRSAVHS